MAWVGVRAGLEVDVLREGVVVVVGLEEEEEEMVEEEVEKVACLVVLVVVPSLRFGFTCRIRYTETS